MSDLLNKASLVMIPSGYKEDIVYSAVPSDGSGDLSFTRASNGTRVNSAGLVEVCPWNLVQQSSVFNVSPWAFTGGVTFTGGFTDASGGTNAFRFQATSGSYKYGFQTVSSTISQVYTHSIYAKCSSGTQQFKLTDAQQGGGSLQTVTTEWQRFTFTLTATGGNIAIELGSDGTNALDIYICFAQTNIGSTAKPYFPTTDRLNVPRLTYQNGGGGCPSLLLEKQSTNLLSYSQDFTQSYWSKTSQGVGSNAVVTANYAISPDGTQNATRFVCNLNGGTTTNDRSWMLANFSSDPTTTLSIWIKLNSAGTKTFIFSDSGGNTKTISGTDWQRIDTTFTGGSGEFRIGLIGGLGTSDTLDCCIWGAQAESSSYPTSYIPTTTASATRVADVMAVNLPNTDMTFCAYLECEEAPLGTTAGDWLAIYSDISILGRGYGYANTFGFADAYGMGVTSATKMVWKQESGTTAKLFKNGALVATSTTGTYSDPFNRFRIDGAYLDKPLKVKEFLFFQNNLTDAECAALTA